MSFCKGFFLCASAKMHFTYAGFGGSTVGGSAGGSTIGGSTGGGPISDGGTGLSPGLKRGIPPLT